MTVYVAYLNDRHCDPEIRVFADRDRAISETRKWMRKSMAYKDGIQSEHVEGYELFLTYAYESDSAFVVACDVE